MANDLTKAIDSTGVVACEFSITAEARDQINGTISIPKRCVRFQQRELAVHVEWCATARGTDCLAVLVDGEGGSVRVAGISRENPYATVLPDHGRKPAYRTSCFLRLIGLGESHHLTAIVDLVRNRIYPT